MRYKCFVSLVALFLHYYSPDLNAENNDSKWVWLQKVTTFRPVVASVYEPRVGFITFGNRNNIRLDIGSGIDIIGKNYESKSIAIGAEFFTYTLLESWKNMHFPVIAVDYFFGLKVSYSKLFDENIFSWRFRFSHISAHFVDGHFDSEEGGWRDGREPIIYSREFLELLFSYQFHQTFIYRFYGGGLYLINVTPSWIGKIGVQGGLEIFIPTSIKTMTPYIAYDLRLTELQRWHLIHSVQTGVKLGNRFARGIDLFVSYYSGLNVQGELFDEKISYWGGGFNIHF